MDMRLKISSPHQILKRFFDPCGVSIVEQLDDVSKKLGVFEGTMANVSPVPDVGEGVVRLEVTAMSTRDNQIM